MQGKRLSGSVPVSKGGFCVKLEVLHWDATIEFCGKTKKGSPFRSMQIILQCHPLLLGFVRYKSVIRYLFNSR